MSVIEAGVGIGSLRTLEIFKTPYEGIPSRTSLGAFSLFFIWFKNEYYGLAKDFTIKGVALAKNCAEAFRMQPCRHARTPSSLALCRRHL
jgi:hypothetical protein